jgi:hypothetical protein
VLSMVWDMNTLLLPRFLVVQPDSRDDDTCLKENYVPHGMTRQNNKIVSVITCY